MKADPPTRRLDSAMSALNYLAMAAFDKTRSSEDIPLTSVQLGIMDDLWRRVLAYGGRPDGLDDDKALKELGCNANLYMQEAKNVVDLDASQIKILSRQLQPISARDLAPPAVQAFLDRFGELVERPTHEMEQLRMQDDLVEPHWDPGLKRSRSARFQLYDKLFHAGLLTVEGNVRKRGWGFLRLGRRATNLETPRGSSWIVGKPMPCSNDLRPPGWRLQPVWLPWTSLLRR